MEAEKLNNEINRELSKPDFNEEYTISLIMARAAERYASAADDAGQREIGRLRAELEKLTSLKTFDPSVFEQMTDALLISNSGNIALRLKCGYIISENAKEAV